MPVLLVLLAALATSAALAPGAFAATPGDVAATKALREAELRRERAIAKAAPAAVAAWSAFVSAVGRECPDVLHGVPQIEELSSLPSPRKRGELDRAEEQLSSVQDEADGALSSAGAASTYAAFAAFRAETAKLNWTDPRVRKALDFEASVFSATTTRVSSASLCGDLRRWAQSGYRTLAPGTKAYVASFETAFAEPPGVPDPTALLRPSESPASRRLEKEAERVRLTVRSSLGAFGREATRLRRELGETLSPFEERETEPVIGRGHTHTGETLIVKRAARGHFLGAHCKHGVSVEFRGGSNRRAPGFVSDAEQLCLSSLGSARPQISCDRAAERLTMALPARARSVRLRLSDGSEIVGRTVAIPRADGGPASVYAETLRRYEPHPVSVTAVAADGAVVRSVRIPASERCRRRPLPDGPKFIPLLHATTPNGEPFEIEGVLVRFGRRSSFSVSVSRPQHESGISRSSSISISIGGGKPQAFELQLSTVCRPNGSWIVYGLLAPPGASVEVRTSSGLTELTEVPLAAAYDSRGPLEYGAFVSPPLEVIVRRADGTVLHSEAPIEKVVEEAEYCEGFAEPSS